MQPKSNTSIFTQSLQVALCGNKLLAEYFTRKHNVNIKEEWISTAKMVDTLCHMEEKVGAATVHKVGAHIASIAQGPYQIGRNSFQKFLVEDLNEVYRHNHQLLHEGFKISTDGTNFYLNLIDNPYPLSFNKGLIRGFSFKHNTLNNIYEVDKEILKIEKVI